MNPTALVNRIKTRLTNQTPDPAMAAPQPASATRLTREFAARYAKRVVPANLRAITISKLINLGLLGAAIGCTYSHQANHLTAIDGFGMSVGRFDINLGYVAPLIWDVAMLSNANVLQTPAMAKSAKQRATIMMAVNGGISMAVNLELTGLLGGSWASRVLFAVLVALAVGQKWAGAAIRPDFAELGELEAEATAQVKAQPSPSKHTCKSKASGGRTTPGCPGCDDLVARKAAKAAATPRRSTRKGSKTSGDALDQTKKIINAAATRPENAPVSGAPVSA